MGLAGQAIPYCGPPPSPGELFAHWNLDPLIVGPLLLGFAVVVMMGRCLPAPTIRAAGLALFALALAFVSPLCALSSALFAARTVHHVLLICVVAPLIVLALPRPSPQGFAVVLIATGLQAAVLWFWHAPALYEAALSNHGIYAVMEITLLASATLFWGAIRSATALTAALGLVVTMVQMGMLGALLVFASAPVYGPHLLTTAAWAMTPLQDQQLAGLIMWAPAAGVYLATALILVARWMGPDRAVVERQPA